MVTAITNDLKTFRQIFVGASGFLTALLLSAGILKCIRRVLLTYTENALFAKVLNSSAHSVYQFHDGKQPELRQGEGSNPHRTGHASTVADWPSCQFLYGLRVWRSFTGMNWNIHHSTLFRVETSICEKFAHSAKLRITHKFISVLDWKRFWCIDTQKHHLTLLTPTWLQSKLPISNPSWYCCCQNICDRTILIVGHCDVPNENQMGQMLILDLFIALVRLPWGLGLPSFHQFGYQAPNEWLLWYFLCNTFKTRVTSTHQRLQVLSMNCSIFNFRGYTFCPFAFWLKLFEVHMAVKLFARVPPTNNFAPTLLQAELHTS